jgi:hypothetical protein
MWQKFLFSSFLLLITCMFNKAYAQTVEVCALKEISTSKPPTTTSIRLLEPLAISETDIIEAGSTLNGNVVDVVSPKRLKRDATFSFEPKYYTNQKGETTIIKSNIKATYTTQINKTELAKDVALGVGSYFVKGLSVGVATVSGAVKNEEGNRLKSSITSAYEATPVSYIEKGEELDIKKNEHFYLKFQIQEEVPSNEVKGKNYSFTIEKE